MSEQTGGDDPFSILRDAYAKSVDRWAEAMEGMVGRQDFAAASAQLLALYAQQQQSIRAASRVAAESIHMPTTEDLAEVARLVVNVERKADEVTDQVAQLLSRLAAIEASIATLSTAAEATDQAAQISSRLAAVEAGIATLTELAQRPAPAPAPQAPAPKTGAPAPDAPAPGDMPKPARARSSAKGSSGSPGTTRSRTPRSNG